jgi:tight adherence protein B
MTPIVLWLGAFSFLLIAAGIALWAKSQLQSTQRRSAALVDLQINSDIQVRQTLLHADQANFPQRRQSVEWEQFFLRAGAQPSAGLFVKLIVPAVVLTAAAELFGGVLSAACTLLLYVVLTYFFFWLRIAKRQQMVIRQLPAFLDTLVRLVTIGNSLASAFQNSVPSTDGPLRIVLERASRMVQAGVALDHALRQEAAIFRIKELELLASVISLAGRFGGRTDQILERMAAFMRDLEYAQKELVALSAETRLSAWVMGLLPVGLGIFLVIFNNKMFMNMWLDPLGRNMLLGAGALELLGSYWLYRLAKSV